MQDTTPPMGEPQHVEQLVQQPDAAQLRKRIVAYVLKLQMQREHSRKELAEKVARKLKAKDWEMPAEMLAGILDDMERQQWVSDARVAESVVNCKSARWGMRKIKHHLQNKGVSEELVLDATEQLASSEYERALHVWAKKFAGKELDVGTPKVYAKQVRFLAGRGFGAEVVGKVMRFVRQEAE